MPHLGQIAPDDPVALPGASGTCKWCLAADDSSFRDRSASLAATASFTHRFFGRPFNWHGFLSTSIVHFPCGKSNMTSSTRCWIKTTSRTTTRTPITVQIHIPLPIPSVPATHPPFIPSIRSVCMVHSPFPLIGRSTPRETCFSVPLTDAEKHTFHGSVWSSQSLDNKEIRPKPEHHMLAGARHHQEADPPLVR